MVTSVAVRVNEMKQTIYTAGMWNHIIDAIDEHLLWWPSACLQTLKQLAWEKKTLTPLTAINNHRLVIDNNHGMRC